METIIRLIVKNNVLSFTPKNELDIQIFKVITNGIKEIEIAELRDATFRSLWNFYLRQYDEWMRLGRLTIIMLVCIMIDNNTFPKGYKPPFNKGYTKRMLSMLGDKKVAGLRQKTYIKKVKKTIDKLCQQYALDPDDISSRNSMRNRAEMEVRYQEHQDNIKRLKDKGVKLVIASAHKDCSERCRPWQGKVYSLNHTSGITSDGREYQPLENATDIYYTTRMGKTYKNGLLGFNCRHYLVEFHKGKRFPTFASDKQYEITQSQRAFERAIRDNKVKAIMYKGIDNAKYEQYADVTKKLTNAYKMYSKKHDRPYYRSRIEII